jgi:hypothetical protein
MKFGLRSLGIAEARGSLGIHDGAGPRVGCCDGAFGRKGPSDLPKADPVVAKNDIADEMATPPILRHGKNVVAGEVL